MNRKLKLEKGQEVVVRYINDRIRYMKDSTVDNIDKWTSNGKVTKVGRKYIEVDMNGWLEKFDIEFDYVQKTNIGSPDYKLYSSKEEIINEIETEELYREVKNHFGDWHNRNKFTLSQLKQILDIANENSES